MCRRHLGPEQYRDPSCAFVVLAHILQSHGQGYAQNHTDKTEQAPPKNQREKYNQRGQAKPPAHEPRLDHVAESEFNGQVSDSRERGTAYPELDKGEKNCGNASDNGADVRYIVE